MPSAATAGRRLHVPNPLSLTELPEDVICMPDPRALMLPRQLIRRFRTRDPYELADLLGVTVMPRNNFLRQKGAFSIVAGRSFIFINANLSAELQRLVCAHELGHALLHREIALSGGAMLEFDLLDAAGRCEVEANTFAAALLLDDEELRERLHDGEDIQSIARAMGVHVDLILLRLQTMPHDESNLLPRIPSRKFLGSIGDDAGLL